MLNEIRPFIHTQAENPNSKDYIRVVEIPASGTKTNTTLIHFHPRKTLYQGCFPVLLKLSYATKGTTKAQMGSRSNAQCCQTQRAKYCKFQ